MASSLASDSKSRRERGVIAQREYRKRHASKFKQLQDENTRLRNAIKGIIAVSDEHRLPPRVHMELQKAKTIADLGDDTPSPSEDKAEPVLHSPPPTSPKKSVYSANKDLPRPADGPPDFAHHDGRSTTEPPPQQSSPPEKKEPYVGKNMFTLEGRLFWDYMTLMFVQLYQHVMDHETELLNPAFLHSGDEDEQQRELTVAIGNARLQYYRSTGPEADPKDFPPLMARIARQQQGFRTNSMTKASGFWNTPEQVAEFLLTNLSAEDVQIIKDSLVGKLSPELEKNVGMRLYPFAKNAVCFGDGPRWSKLFLSLAVGIWVSGSHNLHDPDDDGT